MKQVLYFSAEWCGPCKIIKPKMMNLQSQMTITFVDADTNTDICTKWNVRSVPTLLVIKNGIEVGLVGMSITEDAVINLYNK